MKIAILGSRGIPNNYGGPERNAEMMAPIFIRLGHEVTVYSPDEHPYQGSEWQGIRIKHIFNRESRLGVWGTLAYDILCLRDALASDVDIILELGYVPCAIFYPLCRPRRARLITNMDGLEWKRSKWNVVLQRFARLTETLGARYSDALIADNEAIRDYLWSEHAKSSHFIPYGAVPVAAPHPEHLAAYGVQPGEYFMLIARLEPENSIETILDGYLQTDDARPFLVVGKTTTRYGRKLTEQYQRHERVRFLGSIYDYATLSSLRWQAAVYFHGHSVGGTNPSLVEAMASHAFIAAHDNPFNRSVLGDNACYFDSAADVTALIRRDHGAWRNECVARNLDKAQTVYNWEVVALEHLRVFEEVLARA